VEVGPEVGRPDHERVRPHAPPGDEHDVSVGVDEAGQRVRGCEREVGHHHDERVALGPLRADGLRDGAVDHGGEGSVVDADARGRVDIDGARRDDLDRTQRRSGGEHVTEHTACERVAFGGVQNGGEPRLRGRRVEGNDDAHLPERVVGVLL